MRGSMEEVVKAVREFGPDTDLKAAKPEVVESDSDQWYECRKCGWVYHIDDTHTTVDYDGSGPTCNLDDGPPIHVVDMDLRFVGVYAIQLSYGGPEEGGWWYTQGELDRQFAAPSMEAAEALREQLEEVYPNTGRSSSVLGGEDWAIYISDRPFPTYFPKTRPHYE